MGFPNSLDKSSPADTDNPSAGAAQIRNLKIFLEDLFGIQDAVTYSAAPFAIGSAGQVTVAQQRLLFQNGTATVPGFAFSGATGSGLSYDSANSALGFLVGATQVARLSQSGLYVPTGVTGTVLGMVDVAASATGGTGTSGDPWTGWESALTTDSRHYFFRPGVFLGDGFIPASNSLYSGAGTGVTTLKLKTNNKNLISNWNAGSPVYDLHHITIRDMTLDGSYSTLADPLDDNTSMGVYLLYADYVAVRRVEMKNFWFDGINVLGSRYFWIENNLVVNCGDKNTYLGYYDGIAFDAASGADARTRGAYGTIQGNIVRNCGGGIRNNGVTAYTDSAHSYLIALNQIISPTMTGINLIDIYGKTHVHRNLIYRPGTYGIHVETTNTVGVHPYYAARDVQIVGNTVDGPDQNGVGLAGISAAAVSGLQISGNAISNIPAGADGIQALSAVDADGVVYRDRPKVVGNTIRGAATAKWGIQINADRGIVGDNDITGGFSGGGGINVAAGTDTTVRSNVLQGMSNPLTDSGTTTRFSGNIGYRTRNSGVSGALSTGATIAHGLAATPEGAHLTALDSSGVAITATVDATNITVNFAGGGTHVVSWEVWMTGDR